MMRRTMAGLAVVLVICTLSLAGETIVGVVCAPNSEVEYHVYTKACPCGWGQYSRTLCYNSRTGQFFYEVEVLCCHY